MSPLAKDIADAGPKNVAALVEQDPDFAVFGLLWQQPGRIIPACERMGWQSLGDLLSWVQRVNEAMGDTAQAFVELVDPPAPLALAGLPTAPWAELHKAIHATGLLAHDCLLDQSDALYHLPTKAQWDAIAAACPSQHWKHAGNETLDCDDHVRIAMGWLSAKGLGNCAAARAATRHKLGTTVIGGHAVVLVWDDTLTPWQWEPQKGTLHPVAFAKLGGHTLAQNIVYARVLA